MASLLMLLLVLFVMLAPPSSARMGYDIVARVNSSSVEIHRATQEMGLDVSSRVEGSGNFSKFSSIQGFGGVRSLETSSSPSKGNLSCDERVILKTREGPVTITIKFEDDSESVINATDKNHTTLTESADIKADERWPTYYLNYRKTSYLGSALRAREIYSNNEDLVATSGAFWKLSRSSQYTASSNRSVVYMGIASERAYYVQHTNSTSQYLLDMESTGPGAHIDLLGRGQFGDDIVQISQDYIGQQKMLLNFSASRFFRDNLLTPSWLDCCPGGQRDAYRV